MKMSMMQLSSVVRKQETKISTRISTLAGKFESDRKVQAQVNNRLGAEMRRLMRMGAHREMARLRSNRRLQSIIKANAAKTKMNISRMRSSFTVGLEKLRQQARR